jgi:hypothetical protein
MLHLAHACQDVHVHSHARNLHAMGIRTIQQQAKAPGLNIFP